MTKQPEYEYEVFTIQSSSGLKTKLNSFAADGYRCIKITCQKNAAGDWHTVIMERKNTNSDDGICIKY